MTVLFDHNVDRRFRKHLSGHLVHTVREMGWDQLANGELLRAAAAAAFDALITVDKNLEHQQNLDNLPLPVIVLDTPSNALPALLPLAPSLIALLSSGLNRELYVLGPGDADIRRVSPRP